jgi:hypothetical protein
VLSVIEFDVEAPQARESLHRRIASLQTRVTERTHRMIGREELLRVTLHASFVTGQNWLRGVALALVTRVA